MKTSHKIALISQGIGGIIFATSFFVSDNKVAVSRRWVGLGFFVGGVVVYKITEK